MINWLIGGMVFSGAALMVYNIYGFIRFSLFVQGQKSWNRSSVILRVPIVLLIFFLLGYLAVGLFGKPDLIVAGILFGGSVFVFIMYNLLNSVTQQILESERMEASLMAAEESNRAKSAFLANMSHEMRTPMNVILGLNNLMLNDPTLPEGARTQAEKIGLSAKHLLGLINNMLEMNGMENNSMTVIRAPFSLSDTLDQVSAIVQTLCDEKGLQYAADIPPLDDVEYLGDALRIRQVLLGVMDNAVKYTDAPGRVSFTVRQVSEDAETRTLEFIVADTGVGIAPEFLPQVFDAFTQEDASSTNRFGGGGLGLSVTKRLVERIGGAIRLESAKNAGTTAYITLPLQTTGAKAPEKPENVSESLEGKRVLVVEDIPENAEIVMDLLELESMECEHAENGQAALDMFSQRPAHYYDAILMDLRMPVMDGLEATRRIRALDRADAKTIPIIAVTANAYDSDVKATREAGMNAHLAKPTDSDLLYESLKRLI